MRQIIFFYTASGPATGLTPAWLRHVKQVDRSSVNGPDITEDANGLYYYDATPTEQMDGVIDAGDAAVLNRYLPITYGPADNKISIVEEPSGTYSIAIITKDALNNRVPNVQVAIINVSGQTVRTVTTDSNGDATITLDAGSFSARAFKAMTNIDSIDFTVTGSTTLTIACTVITANAPSAGKQNILIYPKYPSYLNDINVEIYAEAFPKKNNFFLGGLFTPGKTVALPNVDHFEMQLTKGAQFRIIGKKNSEVFLDKIITVSDADVQNLDTYGN